MAFKQMIKAKPTEWMGTVYRSKSEALMAVYLHQLGYSFEYEPLFLSIENENWSPDFLAWKEPERFSDPPGRQSPPMPLFKVIEYKPDYVTDTYRKQLTDRFSKLWITEFKDYDLLFGGVSFVLFEGSFWKSMGHRQTLFTFMPDYRGRVKSFLNVYDFWPADPGSLRDFRFDLADDLCAEKNNSER